MTGLVLYGLLILVGGLVAAFSVRAIRGWPGVWGTLAWLPVVMIATHIGLIVFETRRDPTSHSFWPLELLFVSGAALVLLGILAGARQLRKGC